VLRWILQKLRGESQATRLPGYTPLGTIREGSMSIIFRAKHRQTGRIVAVKVLKPAARKAVAKLESRYRNLTEGQMTALFDHPNVIKCLDHGDLAGAPYLVLEYLEGITLSGLMAGDSKRLEGQRLAYLRQGAAALVHIHARSIIHHDFCSKNLFVTNEDRVVLIDFGLATPLLDKPTVGSRMGTAEILAPEVLRREPSDHRVDLFAWGVVAYQVLSGHWPFESTEHRQMLSKILNVHPVPLTRRVRNLPEEIAGIIMRCLEKDQTRRPNHISAPLGVLERYQQIRF